MLRLVARELMSSPFLLSVCIIISVLEARELPFPPIPQLPKPPPKIAKSIISARMSPSPPKNPLLPKAAKIEGSTPLLESIAGSAAHKPWLSFPNT